MSIIELLRTRRQLLEEDLGRRGLSHTLSLARFRLHRNLSQAIEQHAHGRCLDAGSGRSPYRALLDKNCTEVVSIDVEDRSGKVDLIADLQEMFGIPDGSFDTVLCSQVLEHIPRPQQAVKEIARVLRPGGTLILSVPHLSVIHEAPHDYFRFTSFGIKELSVEAGLDICSLVPTGGLICFLTHGASLVVMSSVGLLPLLRWPTWSANYLFLVRICDYLDRWFGFKGAYPCDYLAVAVKEDKKDGAHL